MSNAMRFTALGLASGAVVLLVLVQFVPLESESMGGMDLNANLWSHEVQSEGTSVTTSWSECDDGSECEGTGAMQAGAIILTVGMAAAVAAAILLGIGISRAGAIVALGGTAVVLAGFLFWTTGYGQGDGFSEVTDPSVGFFLAIFAMVLLLAAGVVGLLPRGEAVTETKASKTPRKPKKNVNF